MAKSKEQTEMRCWGRAREGDKVIYLNVLLTQHLFVHSLTLIECSFLSLVLGGLPH